MMFFTSMNTILGPNLLLYLSITIYLLEPCSSSGTRNLRNDEPELKLMSPFISQLLPTSDLISKDLQTNNETMIHEREFTSPQLKIQIECQKDRTLIKLYFNQPFAGTIGAGRLESTKCKIFGNKQEKYYELKVNHNETLCDTQWDSSSNSIFNTLFVRFHQSLETGADLAKNIMCRLTVGDLIVGRRPPSKKVQSLNGKEKEKLKSSINKNL